MIDEMRIADQPVRFNARTWRGVLAQMGLIAAAACQLTLTLALGYGWDGWMLAIPVILFIVIFVPIVGYGVEWTVVGHELRSRRWRSLPGRQPSLVGELGPQVEIVHETRNRWRIAPYGPEIYVWPRSATSLTGAMERAGVRVTDWRGDWARRHRRLDRLGLAIQLAASAGVFVAIALGGPMRPFGFVAFWTSWGALYLALAIDYLPWRRHRRSIRQEGWPAWPTTGPWH